MKNIRNLSLLLILLFPSVVQSSAITVVTPNGGENWLIGCQNTIQWIATSPLPVRIELFKNGTFYMTIVNQVPSSQNSYSWTPSYAIAPGSTFRVKISCLTSSAAFDFSDADFSINPGLITVTSPNGGEAWLYGTTHMILWNDNLCENVRIELWKGSAVYSLLAASTPSTGSFPWAITSSIPSGSDYKIKIMSTAATAVNTSLVYDFSDNNFTVGTASPCFVTVTSPNGGETWIKGTTHLITWLDNVTWPVRIELWKSGVYKSLITGSAPATGSYYWAIPMTVVSGNDYKIKILTVASSVTYNCYDFSDNNFTLAGSNTGGLKDAGSNFNVFPNPCNESLNIDIDGSIGANVSVRIIQVTGKTLRDLPLPDDSQKASVKINTTDIADGFYILLIRKDQEIVYKKTFIVRH